MDLVHVTSYVDGETFEKMERVRKAKVRQTRSQWINEAIVERAEREEKATFPAPTQSPRSRHKTV